MYVWKLPDSHIHHVQLFATPWTVWSMQFSSQDTGVGSLPFSRGSNPGLPHCRESLYQLSYQGTPHGCILTSKFVKVYTSHMQIRRIPLHRPRKLKISLFLLLFSHQVVCDSLQPHGLEPAGLLCPLDSPSKNAGVGRHSLLRGVFSTQESKLGLLWLLHFWWIFTPEPQGSGVG